MYVVKLLINDSFQISLHYMSPSYSIVVAVAVRLNRPLNNLKKGLERAPCNESVTQLMQVQTFKMAFGRSVLVTGSNRGIGFELVKQLAKKSSPPEFIFAACRSPDQATDLKELAKESRNIHIVKLDVCNESDIKDAHEVVKKHVGDLGLNVLINNAGILTGERKIEDVTPSVMMETFRTNVIGPTMLIKEFMPLLRQASKNEASKPMSCSRAAILNMSSKVGSIDDNSSGRNYSYRMSKIALNMVNKNLSIELKDDGILAVVLHPGWVQTDMGGASAFTPTAVSAEGLLKVSEGLREKDNGLFYDFNGKLIPW